MSNARLWLRGAWIAPGLKRSKWPCLHTTRFKIAVHHITFGGVVSRIPTGNGAPPCRTALLSHFVAHSIGEVCWCISHPASPDTHEREGRGRVSARPYWSSLARIRRGAYCLAERSSNATASICGVVATEPSLSGRPAAPHLAILPVSLYRSHSISIQRAQIGEGPGHAEIALLKLSAAFATNGFTLELPKP